MGIIQAILAVFTSVGEWFGTAFETLIPIFWTTSESGGSLTFIGTLTLMGLAVAVILLLLNMIKDFLRFR